jgi:hypothetical protein
MATVALLGTPTFNTTGGNTTVVATPTAGDLIVIVAATSGLAGGTTSVTDNNSDGRGTYVQVDSDRTGFSTTGVLTVWVRNALVGSATSTTFTANQATSTGGGLVVLRVTGMSIVGLSAVRRIGVASYNTGGQSSGTAATTPAPVLAATPLTANPIITAVANGTNSATTVVQRAGYTEDFDNGYNTPATGLEVSHLNSGETSATITYGGTTASTFASFAIELDTSVPQYDYAVQGRADKDREIVFLHANHVRASFW